MTDDSKTKKAPSCPLCQNISHKVLYRVHARASAEHMFHFSGSQAQIRGLVKIIIGLWGTDTASMLKCESCQLIFADPFIAGSSEFYSSVYRNESHYPEWKWDYEITLRDLQKCLDPAREYPTGRTVKDSRLLEVGAGNGAFAKRLADGLFLKENLLCTEYSDYGSKQITGLGIPCISDPIQVLRTEENKNRFNFICMFQVLEHMDNLKDHFETLNHLSGLGTILYITVPSESYRAFYDRLGRHMDTPPNHLTRWNYGSFQKLGDEFGWRLMEHQNQSMSYTEKLKRLIFDRLDYHGLFRSSNWAGRKLPAYRKVLLASAFAGMVLAHPYAVIKLGAGGLGISQWVKFIRE